MTDFASFFFFQITVNSATKKGYTLFITEVVYEGDEKVERARLRVTSAYTMYNPIEKNYIQKMIDKRET